MRDTNANDSMNDLALVAEPVDKTDKVPYHKRRARKVLDKSLNAPNKDVKGGADRAHSSNISKAQALGIVDEKGQLRPLPDQYYHP